MAREQIHLLDNPEPIVISLLRLLSQIGVGACALEIPEGYMDVPRDGLCFYHAVAELTQGTYRPNARVLQEMTINEIINHPDRYEGFVAQYGGLNRFLSYHLQHHKDSKEGWADNIMIQALANALECVIEVQLFDLCGHAIGRDPIIIVPHNNPDSEEVLRLGNIGHLHFVARGRGGELARINIVQEEHKIEEDHAAIQVNELLIIDTDTLL